jgi:lipoprotein NlpI
MAARGDKSQATGDDDTRIAVAIAREYEGEAHTLTAQIESGTVDKQRIAQALVDRAIAYSRLGRRDGALADLQRAMGLDPTVARPYVVRAEVYTGAGDFDHALADFATAVKLDPQVDVAQSRGQAYFLKGDYRAAQADLKRASEAASGEKQLHLLIWLYLATQRVGEDARALVSGIRARADLSQWPGPAVMMLLGETKPEDMLSSAWSFDRKTELLQRCEAYFFLGQYRLLNGDPEQARAAFEVSAATGMTHYVEYSYSKLELSRMGTSSTAKRAAK